MTSLAPNSAPTNTSPASSNTPSAHSASQSTSGQSSTIAAATAGSRSYAQAPKKSSYTPPIVSSTVGPSPPVVSGAPGSNARTSNASPVNGKTQVQPAVPTVTPAMSGANVIVNGTSGPPNGHGRKPSIVSGGNGGGAWGQNGNPHTRPQQNNPAQIQFGSFPANLGNPVSSPNLSAPAINNPRISSPQMSPSPLPQPAVSGGGNNPQVMQNQNITFGSLGADRNDQRSMHTRPQPMQIPPVPTPSQGPGAGHRREASSTHQQQHPEISQPGMGSNRGGLQANGGRRNQGPPYGQSNYHSPGYNSHNSYNNNRNTPNQSRGSGYPTTMNTQHYPNVQGGNFPNTPRQAPRSPAPHHNIPHTQPVPHSLPGTPQLPSVQIANSPSFSPANIYPAVPQQHQHQQYLPPTAPPYDPNMYHYHHPMQYSPAFTGPPPASPQRQYANMGGPYMPIPYSTPPPTAMARTSSGAAPDIHRQPSMYVPPHQAVVSSVQNTTPNMFQRPEKAKGVKITTPDGTALSFKHQPEASKSKQPLVVTSSSSPLIVSSGNPPPRPPVTESVKKSAEEIQEIQREVRESVAKKLEEEKKREEEEKKRQEEEERKRQEEEERKRQEEEAKKRQEEEEKKRQEEEERLRKEKEAEEERLRKEEEERLRKEEEEKEKERLRREAEEEEERKRKEAEAAEAARKAEEEAARLAKEKEEEEKRLEEERLKAEEEKRIKEEQEAAERKAREEAERQRKAKEEADAKAAAEAAAAAAAAAKVAEAAAEASSQKVEPPKPEPPEQATSTAPSAPVSDESTRISKPRGSKPTPLVLKTSNEPGPPSAALTALRSARPIENINGIKYPEGIMSPNPALNAAAPSGKFRYHKEFLLQFQNVFTEKPSTDWDQIIRDSVGEPTDSARPSTARMPTGGLGGGRSGSRPGSTSTQPSMGSMGNFGSGKFGVGGVLPPNMLTSAQRFEQSNSRTGALSSNPLPGLAAVGQFRAGPPSISRTNSSQGLPQQGGALPQSPRNRSQRGSKRGNAAVGGVAMEKTESKQAEPKPVLTIPPSEVKPLVVSETRWKPRTVQAAANSGASPGTLSAQAPPVPSEDNKLSPDMVQRKVKAALNKMTPEKFDKISGQILDIASQSKYETDGRTLRQVIQLTFEKATDEAAWSSMYAKFCKVMMESMDPSIKDESIKDLKTGKVVTGGILFRKYLLNRCQEEFQRGWKVNLPPKPEGETDEAAMLSDEYYIAAAAKRRGLGLIQFIGELFKLGMLTERIMHECVKKLVDYEGIPEEAEVESLCKLLRTIGAALDSTEKSRPSMDAYFARIQTMIDHPEVQSRLKFMLMDIVDLRKKNWEINEVDKGPKTLAEIQADVAKAAAEKEAASRANAQRGARPAGGRNDSRSFSQGGAYGQSDYQRQMAQSNTINSDDLRKLKARDRGQNAAQSTLGPPSMFASRGSNPSRRGGMGPPSFVRGDDSGPASRTATPPSGTTTSRNSFGVLSEMGSHANDGDATDSISPAPSAASSPPMAKATPVMRSLTGKE